MGSATGPLPLLLAGAAPSMWEGSMSDPISRLEFARREIDRVFGSGHARQHPEVVVAVM